MKKVSVIITCYNLQNYISRAISSCLNQTLNDDSYEIIIVDDCSTDRSWSIIQSCDDMKDPDVLMVRHEKNKGVAAASNTGIQHASGEYIIRVDGDDFINKNMLFVMKEVLDNNSDIGFVYCDHTVVEKGKPRHMRINSLEKLLDHGAGVMFRSDYIKAIGGYDETLRNREDYDLILRYIKNFDGYHLKLPYYRYFKRDGSLSTKTEERKILKEQIDLRS